ncbi:GDYXXLXY domain-containing protein [Wolbachia endosymbiont of Anurida maritima]|uniref:GDYXXLXY domain-containing protein n=1 Tax=Wolbachia endosymbiont of Anurida maritima TaxID=2850562 RepID=UPI0035D08704
MRTKVMIVLSVIVLVAMNYGIYEKEQIKKHGETLLLELAPADPRSLMQGDYMQLRYAIERNTPVQELALQQKRGYMVISPDENNVAQFVRFHNKGKI